VKSNRFGATDDAKMWMRLVTKKLQQGNRKGRVDLLNSVVEEELAGELTVRTIDEIPEHLPVGSPVFVTETQQTLVQDPATMQWEPAPSS